MHIDGEGLSRPTNIPRLHRLERCKGVFAPMMLLEKYEKEKVKRMIDIYYNAPELELLTVKQTANYLHVCPNTVRALMDKGIIKYMRVGKHIRIFKQDTKNMLYDLARSGSRITIKE